MKTTHCLKRVKSAKCAVVHRTAPVAAMILLALCTLSCQQRREVSPFVPVVASRTKPALPDATGPMSLQVGVTYGAVAPRFGALTDVKVIVGNGHVQPILIQSVEFDGQVPELFAWKTSLPGQLRQRGRKLTWVRRGASETEEVFARGLLYPGEILEFERPLRVRHPSIAITVRYQELPMSDLGQTILLPDLRRGELDALRVDFSSPSLSDVSAFRKLKPGDRNRLVLSLPGRSRPMRVHRSDYSLTWSDEDMPGRVLQELDVGDAELSRSDSLASWIVRKPGDPALYLYPDGSADEYRLTGMGFEVFDLADVVSAWGTDADLVLPDGDVVAMHPSRFFDHLIDPEMPVLTARVDVHDARNSLRRLAVVLDGGVREKEEEDPADDDEDDSAEDENSESGDAEEDDSSADEGGDDEIDPDSSDDDIAAEDDAAA